MENESDLAYAGERPTTRGSYDVLLDPVHGAAMPQGHTVYFIPEPTVSDPVDDAPDRRTEPVLEDSVAEPLPAGAPVVEDLPAWMLTTGWTPGVTESDPPRSFEPPMYRPEVSAPAPERPRVDEPIAEEPVAEEPTVEDPVAAQPIAFEPTVAGPTVVEPTVAEPVAAEPPVAQPPAAVPFVQTPRALESEVAPVIPEPTVVEPEIAPRDSAAKRSSHRKPPSPRRPKVGDLSVRTDAPTVPVVQPDSVTPRRSRPTRSARSGKRSKIGPVRLVAAGVVLIAAIGGVYLLVSPSDGPVGAANRTGDATTASTTSAPTVPVPMSNPDITGSVVYNDGSTLVVVQAGRNEMTVETNAATRVIGDGAVPDIVVGQEVLVKGTRTLAGTYMAESITLQ